MQRGQATIEYTLLIAAVVVTMCLLVRYPTPVQRLARSVAGAVAHRPPAHRHGGSRQARRPPHRHARPCLCPVTVSSPRRP